MVLASMSIVVGMTGEVVGGVVGWRQRKKGGGSMGRRRAGRWRWEGKGWVGGGRRGICGGIL